MATFTSVPKVRRKNLRLIQTNDRLGMMNQIQQNILASIGLCSSTILGATGMECLWFDKRRAYYRRHLLPLRDRIVEREEHGRIGRAGGIFHLHVLQARRVELVMPPQIV